MSDDLRLELPPPGTLAPNNDVDPLAFYYRPIVGRIFRARIDMGLRLLGGRRFHRLLEIGYGSGLLLPTLARVADRIVGIDLEPEPSGLRAYLADHAITDVELVHGDAGAMPFSDDEFDCVVAFSIFEHVGGDALRHSLAQVARVLEPGGTLLVGVPAVHLGMTAAFRAIGFHDIDHHHVSDLSAILAAAEGEFAVEARAAWPPLVGDRLPLGWAPYSTVRLRRR